ncbi:hypothetical protein DDB_G0292228 [Dictyostelium discoideum AX4]|uniref:Putative uncharacterized protein DDB_G0292228 n=1 Tax=Dictyostelium discoideum TaxID=44689 RepID=Y4279_DICDI|nr:hypothetical protein DDB_G0292228 [Dictyostelium discoideum AX4]Q54DJ6.1 RecName: Full=Putative uncharacterized protein DDB_G0292228 [Dictyostelium discoideum]EAL61324.1 hypothetical protein DDB_G0292228 [Dictyostelium discoideum AX4]|eukprot:XP_629731.1 hypothetical protein DDB_G0292228 [Dictyostelium discoideum AX4]
MYKLATLEFIKKAKTLKLLSQKTQTTSKIQTFSSIKLLI